ncbi:MAG: PKD domain-containing protein [Bacteroidia bacterium]
MFPSAAPNALKRLKRLIILLTGIVPALLSTQANANCAGINSAFTPSQTLICGPGATAISFVNNSTGAGAAGAAYTWYLNGVVFDNTSGLVAPTTSTISAVGTYNYMLVAFDAAIPCRDTAIVQVIIRPLPNASFTFTPNNQCAGTTVNFTNTSTGTGVFTTYAWNFGDGGTSTSVSPTHVYAAGGTFSATLTITNGAGCSSTFSSSVTVLPRPVASIAGDDGDGDTQYCLSPVDNTTSDLVTFFNLTTGAVSYSWSFGDGSPVFNTASLASFTHTYTSYGTFTVTMTATGANGCTTTTTLTVIFDKFVSASFVVPLAEFSGCVPHIVTPVNASQNADTYVWNFGDGTPTVTTTSFVAPSHTYTVGGSYTISLVASNSCNSSTSTVGPITVVGPPVINFTATPSPGCSPQVVTFGNTTTGASPTNNYYWDFGNGNTLTGVKFPPAQTYYQGTWTIMLVSGNACGTDTMYRTIVVDTIPHAVITATPLIGCSPLTVSTTNSSTGGALSYQWFIDGVLTYTTATIPNQVFTAPAGTVSVTHTIRLRASNHCGVDDTIVNIVVHPPVVANVTPFSSTICAGSSVTFTQNSTGTLLNYSWTFGNGNTSTSPTPPAQTYATPGTYNVLLTVTGFCGTDTASAIVVVNPMPVAPTAASVSICAGSTATLTATAPGGTYQWYNAPVGGTLLFTGATFVTPVLAATTTYYVQTTSLGCTSPRTIVTVTVNPTPVAPTAAGTTICAGSTATLTATAPGGIYQWYNAASGGTLLNTGASYTTPPLIVTTTYYVQTTVAGCTSPRTAVTVTVNPIPAAPTVAPAGICTGNTATLTATAPGGTYTWHDSLTGGTLLSTGAAYTTPVLSATTTYYIQTTIAGCSSPMTAVTVTVNPIPVADIVPDVSAGCAGLVVHFNNNSTLGGTYNWSFAGAIPSTSTAYSPPPVTFNTSGNNMVFITVSVSGCVMRDTTYISIAPLPTPAFTVTPASGCSPVTSSFTNTSGVTAGDTYFWDLDNGNTSTLFTPPSQTYTATTIDSTYTIQLLITAANGCSDSVSHTVIVHANPLAAFSVSNDTVCSGTAISYFNTSAGATTYQWSFGDATTSTAVNPAHTYPGPNSYTVQMIATSAFACKDTAYQLIVVDSVPVAGFTNTTECFGFATHFTSTSLGGIVSWSWNFGDGSPVATTANPSHNYPANGIYNATLTVTNSFGCSNSITHAVIVNAVPVAAFNATTVCLGQATAFSDMTSGTPISWNWNFGDASAAGTVQNPSHVYAVAGTYNVTLIAFGGSGCSDTISNNVTVNPVPSANFTFANVCTNDAMNFNSTSLGAPDTYSWNFGDGFSDNTNNPSPTHTYSTAGIYNVTLTAGYSGTGCTNSITLAVTAYPLTVPAFTSTTPCLNVATAFTDHTTNSPVQWSWNFGDGANSTLQNPIHTYGAPGTYTVTLVTQNIFGCADSVTITSVVNPLPVAAFAFDTICANAASSFTDQSASAVAWNWNFGDGATSAANSPAHIYPAAGTYNSTLIVTNIFGCTDTTAHSIIVNPNPVSLYTASTACHTYPTVFTDNSTAAVGWSWDFGDTTPADTIQSPTHVFANPGNYNVTLLVTNIFGCTNTSVQTVTVLQQPVADFSFSTVCARQAVQFLDATTGVTVTSWNWDFGDGTPQSSLQDPSHTYLLGGNYNVTLIVGNSAGCSDTIIKPVVVNTVPTPLFTANASCEGTITSFTDLSTDAVPIATWFYDFADGNNSVSQNPNYIYAAAGTYNVTLTVTNINGCDSTYTLPVNVNVFPTANYSVDTVCIGTPTTFTDLSTGSPVSWTWNFGDGTSSTTGPVTTHVYPAAGSYVTQLTASSGAGCTDVAFQIVVVRSDVQADISAPNSVCVNELVAINDASVVTTGFILSDTWDFGDGTPLANTLNTTHVYPVAGTYIITHVVTSDGGCSSTALDTIVVNPLPVAAYTTANTCQFQPGNFTDNSTGGVSSWSWNFGDGTSSALQDPTHTYPVGGGYNVTLIVNTAAGCADTVSQFVTIYSQPAASFTSNVVCWGDTTTFNNTSATIDGTIAGVWWDFGDGTNSTALSPGHVFGVQADTFNVTMAIVTSYGCVDTVTQMVTTYPLPVFSYGPQQTSGCNEFTTQFNDNSTVSGGTIVNWFWDFGDSNYTFTQNPIHTYDEEGTYYPSLTVTTSYGCQLSDTMNFPVVVYPRPIAEFSASPNETSIYDPQIQFTDLSQGATIWNWDLGDNENSILQNPGHIYPDTGEYTVTLIAMNSYGCTDTAQHPVYIHGETTVFIPNAFTPNDNGLNDEFAPKLFGVIEFEMRIFDRWGNEIFKTTDLNEGWNGRVHGVGEIVQQDVYVYKIFTKDLLHNNHSYIGTVTIVK